MKSSTFITSAFKKSRLYYSSLIIYASSLLFSIACDIFIGRNFPPSEVANWAFIKSTIFIATSLTLLGSDHILVRFKLNVFEFIRINWVKLVIVLTLTSLTLMYLKNEKIFFLQAFFIIGLHAINMLFFAAARIRFQLLTSQLFQNAWRIWLFLNVLFAFYFSLTDSINLIVLSTFIINFSFNLFFMLKPQNIADSIAYDNTNQKQYRHFGLTMMGMMLSLNLVIYLDQILLNSHVNSNAIASYFSHAAIIFPPIIALNGYLGFLLGPAFRNKKINLSINVFKKILLYLFVFSLALSVISFFFSSIFYEGFFKEKYQFDPFLAFIFIIIGIMRVCYTLPSSIISVYGEKAYLNKILFFFYFALIIQVIIFFLGIYFSSLPILWVTAFSVLANWVFRLCSSTYYTFLITKNLESNLD